MEHYTTLEEYCQAIRVSPPRWELFDIRSFEENMKTVRRTMPPFKHEFYAIALRVGGNGVVSTGNFTTEAAPATLFFNSPYQIVHWDITLDWEGYYIIFAEDFYRTPSVTQRITEAFPFLLVENTQPIVLSPDQAGVFLNTFRDIYHEFHADQDRSKTIIRHYVNVLLHKVARLVDQTNQQRAFTYSQRDHDLTLVSRFRTLIEVSFQPVSLPENPMDIHQVKYYADRLNVHPNHLNAVVRRITDRTASEHIQQHVLSLAKSKLRNTNLSVKEIAYGLHYRYPNHFTSFFRKQTGLTPSSFRREVR